MSRWIMQHGDHHHKMDDNLYLHYPDTCNVHGIDEVSSARPIWAPRSTPTLETRLAPSRYGWIAIRYETKGVITFFVQLSETCAAWQRREWPAGYEACWDEKEVAAAIENFLWVAECEKNREPAPKAS